MNGEPKQFMRKGRYGLPVDGVTLAGETGST
jgi:hypothetical protein